MTVPSSKGLDLSSNHFGEDGAAAIGLGLRCVLHHAMVDPGLMVLAAISVCSDVVVATGVGCVARMVGVVSIVALDRGFGGLMLYFNSLFCVRWDE